MTQNLILGKEIEHFETEYADGVKSNTTRFQGSIIFKF